jgi:hypothetical protein
VTIVNGDTSAGSGSYAVNGEPRSLLRGDPGCRHRRRLGQLPHVLRGSDDPGPSPPRRRRSAPRSTSRPSRRNTVPAPAATRSRRACLPASISTPALARSPARPQRPRRRQPTRSPRATRAVAARRPRLSNLRSMRQRRRSLRPSARPPSSEAGPRPLAVTISNPNAGMQLTGVAVSASALPAGLTGSNLMTTCASGTATLAGDTLSLSGATLNASTSCTVSITASSVTPGNYSYTSGTVSASGPAPVSGSTQRRRPRSPSQRPRQR